MKYKIPQYYALKAGFIGLSGSLFVILVTLSYQMIFLLGIIWLVQQV